MHRSKYIILGYICNKYEKFSKKIMAKKKLFKELYLLGKLSSEKKWNIIKIKKTAQLVAISQG